MLPLFNEAVPATPEILKLAELTVPAIEELPVLVKLIAPNAPLLPAPILPPKLMFPEPELIVNERAELSRSIVAAEANVTLLLVVVKVVFAPNVTALL